MEKGRGQGRGGLEYGEGKRSGKGSKKEGKIQFAIVCTYIPTYLKADRHPGGQPSERTGTPDRAQKKKLLSRKEKKARSFMLTHSSFHDSPTALPLLTEGSNSGREQKQKQTQKNTKQRKQRACARGTMLGG
jgi:hypothetical protein